MQFDDPEIFSLIKQEDDRQSRTIELIASENVTSAAVMAAQGSICTNKYAEGYPGRRFYEGCQYVDEIERVAIDRAKKLFGCKHANVQPHSGSQANQAAFLALLRPGSTILSMSLDSGGHLTHGSPVNMSGKWFNIVHYRVGNDYLIDYAAVEALALEIRPDAIIAGCSAYSRAIDFSKFRAIADKVGAYLIADMAHIAGIVAAQCHQSPVEHADVVTSTTHKTLRGPRGGLILTNNDSVAKLIDSAVFPGMQGGPLMHVIAAKAIAFKECMDPAFKDYIKAVLNNASLLAQTLMHRGCCVLTGGTDNHIVLVDLRPQGISGRDVAAKLSTINISCNQNSIPFDTNPPTNASGIRLGSPACTSKGLSDVHFIEIGNIISDAIDSIVRNNFDSVADSLRTRVSSLCAHFKSR